MKVSIKNDRGKREYAAYFVVVTAPEFEDGHDFDLGSASDSALYQFLRLSAEGIGHDSEPCSIAGAEDGDHGYALKAESAPNPGRETRRHICRHEFKAGSPEHARAYAQGVGYALNRVSPLSIHGDPAESAFLEGYRAGGHLGICLPRGLDMAVGGISMADGGYRSSQIGKSSRKEALMETMYFIKFAENNKFPSSLYRTSYSTAPDIDDGAKFETAMAEPAEREEVQ